MIGAAGSNFKSNAFVARGTKCERCWRYTEDVGDQEKYPTVCLRCADALQAINYPPYTASSNNGTEAQN
jgi:isoleucyl-tRNA synthetase